MSLDGRNKTRETERTTCRRFFLCFSLASLSLKRRAFTLASRGETTCARATLTRDFPDTHGRYLIKLPAPGSDRFVVEDTGPAAGDRYKKAKYGDDEDDPLSSGKDAVGIAALAGSAEDVPPNFEILVVFALGLLRALLRKMSGEKGVGGKGGQREDGND